MVQQLLFTCVQVVYLQSINFGLSTIIALAMIISMLIAIIAGTSVPIILKRLGFDPD